MTLPCSSVGLIPQVGKMGLGVVLHRVETDRCEGAAVIRGDNIFLDDGGRVSGAVLVEYANQMIAAFEAFKNKMNGKKPPRGFFVGVQDAEFTGSACAGDEISIQGVLTENFQDVSFVSAEIKSGSRPVARMVTKIFEITDQFPENAAPAPTGAALGGTGYPADAEGPFAGSVPSPIRRKMLSWVAGLEKTPDGIAFRIHYPDGFDAYDGHFPGNPILPGVILLETGVLALEIFGQKPAELVRVNKMKISGAVMPGQEVAFSLKAAENGGGQTDFSALIVGENGRPVAKFNGLAGTV